MSSAVASGMRGRVAVVTGATRNIGLATATALVDAGADVVITARTADVLNDVSARLRERGGGKVVAVPGDITVPSHIDELADAALDAFGGVDVIVNNALVRMPHSPILTAATETWETGLSGYLAGPLALIERLRPSMLERGHGSIVNLVSTAAFTPITGLGAYGVLKAAMWAMTRHLAHELAPEIRVNAVCPGTTSEDGGTGGSETWEAVLPNVPLARMGAPEEAARAVLFLASDDSSYTTGQVIFVEGGRVALAGAGGAP